MIKEYIQSTLQNKNTVMLITAILFMAGILSYFNNCEILMACLISIIGIVLIFKEKVSVKYILFWIFIFYLGFFNSYLRVKDTDYLHDIAPIETNIEGQIVSIPNKTQNKTTFFFSVKSVGNKTIKAKTYVTVTGEKDFNIGDYYKMNAKIRTPFKAGNPSQFDYGKYLRNFNAYSTTYVNAENCENLNRELTLGWKFLQNLNYVRANILKSHSKYLQSPNLELLGGVVFGDDAVNPPDEMKNDFINSGLLHILAASGMNVAFIFGFWFLIMRFLRVPYRINILGGMIMVILYTLMTGLGASVLRATLMLLFIQVGKLLDRDSNSVSLLAFVAVLLLLYNPAYMNDVGFQLSFLVTLGLLTTAKVIFDRMENIKVADWIKAGVLIPVVAQIWVAPVQMFYFNTFSLYSVFANIITVPFLSVISFGGFVSSILAVIRPIADFVCMCFDFILKYFLDIIVMISGTFSQLPHALIQTTHPNLVQVIVYYAIVLLITLMIEIGFNKKFFIIICSAIVLLLASTINIPNHNLEVITFDVQNADAFLIKTPQNKYFIIDTAKLSYKSKSSTAKMVILKYLKDRGIKNIEGLILTHFDLDHAGGAVDLMENLNIKKVYVNSMKYDNLTTYKIFETAKYLNLDMELAKNNKEIYRFGDTVIKTYISGVKDNDNENSVITLLSYKDFDMLFTGDAGVVGFDKVKADIPHNVEVLKVGHHGGKGVVDENMLHHLGNEVSIISTGPNTFGHPLKSTLDILENTKIYRTDLHNSIKITSDGSSYNVYIFDSFNKKYHKSDELSTK